MPLSLSPEQRQQLISIEELAALPEEAFPMMALANGYMSGFGHMVSVVTDSFWNHFMWYWRPGYFASQWFWFREFPISHFAERHSLKFWHNPEWTPAQRAILKDLIRLRLSAGKWRTRYDALGIVGKLFHWNRLQLKWLHFCSETITWLTAIDPACAAWMMEVPMPSPEEVNSWLKATNPYRVFGRTQPD